MYKISVIDSFAAAHYLKNYHGKCEQLHGHNYKVKISIKGTNLDSSGMLVDFGILKAELKDVLKKLDHCLLNELKDFSDGNPSAERIAHYVYKELNQIFPDLSIYMVEVYETDTNIAAYLPKDF